MRSSVVPHLYSPKRRILTTRKLGSTQLIWVEPKLGDTLGFQVQTAEETWSVEIEDEKCVQDILRRSKAGKKVEIITRFNEQGHPSGHSRCALPVKLVRFNLDHLGRATAALLMVLSGQANRVNWDKVDFREMRDLLSTPPEYKGPHAWSVLHYVLKHRA